jgi:hypothetical protein
LTRARFSRIAAAFMQLLSAIHAIAPLASIRSSKRVAVVAAMWTVKAVIVAPSGGLSS